MENAPDLCSPWVFFLREFAHLFIPYAHISGLFPSQHSSYSFEVWINVFKDWLNCIWYWKWITDPRLWLKSSIKTQNTREPRKKLMQFFSSKNSYLILLSLLFWLTQNYVSNLYTKPKLSICLLTFTVIYKDVKK